MLSKHIHSWAIIWPDCLDNDHLLLLSLHTILGILLYALREGQTRLTLPVIFDLSKKIFQGQCNEQRSNLSDLLWYRVYVPTVMLLLACKLTHHSQVELWPHRHYSRSDGSLHVIRRLLALNNTLHIIHCTYNSTANLKNWGETTLQ